MATKITIQLNEKGQAEILTAEAADKVNIDTERQIKSLSLQGTWDQKNDSEKNIFVDNNKTAILTHVDAFTWAELVSINGRGFNYPIPTGIAASYRTGDDGDIESTIFGATNRDAQADKAKQTLTNWNTLTNTNVYGDTNRFTDETGAQTYTNDLIIDHYTGLMWYRILSANGFWNDAIDESAASTQGGHSNWFLPNHKQLESLGWWGQNQGILEAAPFNINLNNGWMYLSTTMPGSTGKAVAYRGGSVGQIHQFSEVGKTTSSFAHILCSKHY